MKKLILSVSLMAFALVAQAGDDKACCKGKAVANAEAKTCTAKAGATCSEKAGAMCSEKSACKGAPSKKALLSPKDAAK